MKLIITESRYKSTVFKFFDKFGGEIDNQFINVFSLDKNNSTITYDQAYKYLIEWRGEEESKELTKTLLLQNPHQNNNCGGYDFFFEVTSIKKWGGGSWDAVVVCDVLINDVDGDVTLFDGTYNNLRDALDDEEYGWEIKNEVDWCVNDYFKENITPKTGIQVIYDIYFISKK